MKRLTLCADDFAQSPAISAGILRLVEAGRLQAVSCLTESPHWKVGANELLAVGSDCAIGLHFNLTLPFGQTAHRISTLLALASARAISCDWVRRRFDEQWEAFVRATGRFPDFVDGHQHVHVFPGIREVVVEWLHDFVPSCRVRSLSPPPGLTNAPPKERCLARIARPLPRLLAEAGLSTNRFFAGFRPYRDGADFGETFRRWLAVCPDSTLIMCHPGLAANNPSDPIACCRPGEFGYLASDAFLTDVSEAGAALSIAR
jgi:predicted glycoside hydrolase/deacetylase ChbG (UPF0249 family)